MSSIFQNPFRPGAGHPPPYLAGRIDERKEFKRLLGQQVILNNLVLTGLRGVGKTVLLDTFKPLAMREGWMWVGADFSESTSVSEETIATRLMTDLAVVTRAFKLPAGFRPTIGFGTKPTQVDHLITYDYLRALYEETPGLVADKLKAVLELAWECVETVGKRGIVFAYDEAQNLSDQAPKDQFPLSLLLDIFQSLQKKGMRLMLVLVGLPTLFPKLVEARTFAERMFRVLFLTRLDKRDSEDAIRKPMEHPKCPAKLSEASVKVIVETSGGYPYFIQFICREVYDIIVSGVGRGLAPSRIPLREIERKLDTDFFAGRWARATDRQRDLLIVISKLDTHDDEFTVQEIVETSSRVLEKAFSSSHTNQILAALVSAGLVYKNRHGKYSFAVPLFGQFIRRQLADAR
jgi:hypothetical protein